MAAIIAQHNTQVRQRHTDHRRRRHCRRHHRCRHHHLHQRYCDCYQETQQGRTKIDRSHMMGQSVLLDLEDGNLTITAMVMAKTVYDDNDYDV